MKAAVPRATEPVCLRSDNVMLLTYPELRLSGLEHGIAVFKNLENRPPGPEGARQAADALSAAHKSSPEHVVVPIQKHTSLVKTVAPSDLGEPVTCDGLVTCDAGVMIAVTVADCVPLFAVDGDCGAIGVAHCGWRGIAAGIVEEFLDTFSRLIRRRQDAVYLIGASIGSCCYEVRSDLLQEFPDEEVASFAALRGTKTYFDLKGLVASRLVKSGVGTGQISIDKTCTACHKYLLSSFRAEGRRCGRMLAFLMIKRMRRAGIASAGEVPS